MNVINETRLDIFPFGYAVFVAFAYQSTTRPALNQILLGRDASLNYKKSYFSGRFL